MWIYRQMKKYRHASQPGAVVELRTAATIEGLEETYQGLLSNATRLFRYLLHVVVLAW